MKTYYLSDLHFGHENIIKICNRPFQSIDEMDRILIENWNKIVKKDDTVYLLGDVIYKTKNKTPSDYLTELNGNKHLITGNHEGWMKKSDPLQYFLSVNQILEITDQGRRITLCHYPIAEWNGFHRGAYHIFGHLHNRRDGSAYEFYLRSEKMLNAGVEINHYQPVTFEELVINNQQFRQINHSEE